MCPAFYSELEKPQAYTHTIILGRLRQVLNAEFLEEFFLFFHASNMALRIATSVTSPLRVTH